ncbi:SMI1/KNR4 family protein [Undibacterium umbellatum]|uniref:SMI1/KNR4 family protein n=1 Tax=Undibacterium umbellatum TaxID=2762300 RepID=A0ABR6Z9Z9_9BURK|nr:SMI1/KNR4 family protein [Undibacterium umbellatum]MBC3908583.1 SMI1/KNR4 family protein [Undibacterium umbellatum]
MQNDLTTDHWPPPGCPDLCWPEQLTSETRVPWYRSVITAYASLWEGHVTEAHFKPVSETELLDLETRLSCPLPSALKSYHQEFGALSLTEKLCSVSQDSDTPIQPLLEAYPGIVDMLEHEDEQVLRLFEDMIVFGDYLGNGNMFCFLRESGEVFYFDHDDDNLLCPFFTSVEEYLDALMIRCLAEIHENEEAGLELLAQRYGPKLVRKWLY